MRLQLPLLRLTLVSVVSLVSQRSRVGGAFSDSIATLSLLVAVYNALPTQQSLIIMRPLSSFTSLGPSPPRYDNAVIHALPYLSPSPCMTAARLRGAASTAKAKAKAA